MARVRNPTDRGVLPGGKGTGSVFFSFFLLSRVSTIQGRIYFRRSIFTATSLGGVGKSHAPAGLGFELPGMATVKCLARGVHYTRIASLGRSFEGGSRVFFFLFIPSPEKVYTYVYETS